MNEFDLDDVVSMLMGSTPGYESGRKILMYREIGRELSHGAGVVSNRVETH